jgi:hypothetical protein
MCGPACCKILQQQEIDSEPGRFAMRKWKAQGKNAARCHNSKKSKISVLKQKNTAPCDVNECSDFDVEEALHALQCYLMAPSQPHDGPFGCDIADVR